ncbi:MAG: isoprenylcysteine carboxylmethyltransferase family protein [Candidatus Bathyarchaeota archaeon]|nr:MAG: isoprenylcysteine carboxylmethyltransferase family protein [Candidatus Bathyarchaeota archaeon]
MDSELVFSILFLVLFLLGTAIRGYYTRKVRATRKKRSIRERFKDTAQVEGKFGAILLMVQGVYLIIALHLYLIFSSWLVWSKLPIPDWLRWLGVGVGMISLPFLTWVQHVLGKHWTVSLELREDHKLVTSDPYRWVRHPMYTVHLVYFLTWVLVSANLFLLINYLLTIILMVVRIPKEEQMMLDQFGHEYRAYMKRTRRLLPRFRREADKEE